ncbi:HAMP domain-containing sensor histidine kinase [Telluribacter sp.]|jgi:signal transduction histidine kinase|uniref:sensor histidine kinase n=1 Tax=Telluribacter sp. TaxID=1978767 RepID=UPI002E0E54A8|nr:HAMP domain-containing sensor histidine kinase [Telluribacter sp.]
MKGIRLKLIDQFTLWFLAMTVVVLVAGGIIVFMSVQNEIIREDSRRLKDTVHLVATRLQQGATVDQQQGYMVRIQELSYLAPAVPLHVLDTLFWFPSHEHYERQLMAVASYKIKGKHYHIAASNLVAEPDEIAEGIAKSLSWIFILLLVLVGLLSRLLSRKLLAPFHETLIAVRGFSLSGQTPLHLKNTQIREFEQLNRFLESMTQKAIIDYKSLKEFTENASHELQTPLAVIRGKLELLMDSPITDQQALLVQAALDSIEKLSKTNEALTLLTRLDNREYQTTESIDISRHLSNGIFRLQELFELKGLLLEYDLADNVRVWLHPILADILLNNLLSNAIRHNVPDGKVSITLTETSLVIQNTGLPPQIATEQLFQRFKKSNPSQNSTGLGLAIVKQICDLNDFDVSYLYSQGWHRIEVVFRRGQFGKRGITAERKKMFSEK